MTPFKQQEEFLKLFREGPGYVAFKQVDGHFTQRWFKDIDQALEIIDQYQSTSDIWVSMAKFPSRQLMLMLMKIQSANHQKRLKPQQITSLRPLDCHSRQQFIGRATVFIFSGRSKQGC